MAGTGRLAEAGFRRKQGKTGWGGSGGLSTYAKRRRAVWGSSPMVEHCHAIGWGAQTTLEGIELEPGEGIRKKVGGTACIS